MVQVQVLLLKWEGELTLFLFNFFKVYHFYILEITLPFAQLCCAFEEKLVFFCHHNFMKKNHSKLSKNEPENIAKIKIT